MFHYNQVYKINISEPIPIKLLNKLINGAELMLAHEEECKIILCRYFAPNWILLKCEINIVTPCKEHSKG